MDVADVLRDRMERPGGLQGMVTLSLAFHVAFVAALALAPGQWLGRSVAPPPRDMMTISLSGAGEGPKNGGMTSAPGRSVQEVVPPEQLPRRETPTAPAAKAPEMTIPAPNARQTKARPQVEQAPPDAKARTTPSRGAKVSEGNAIANVPQRGLGFGLSTGGGPGTGSSLEVNDFCCPDYIVMMVDRIRANWGQSHETTGTTIVRFVIQRSGQISDATIRTPSGTTTLDLAALRAVLATKSLPPLPEQFTYRTLPVNLSFEYK